MEIEIEIESELVPFIEVMAEREGVSVQEFMGKVLASEVMRMTLNAS